jgi:hypothetical protein
MEDVERLHMEMHHSVDRMRRLAGLSDDELGFRHKGGADVPASFDPASASAPSETSIAARAS